MGATNIETKNVPMNKEVGSTMGQQQPVTNSHIVRHSSDQYPAICDYLQELGFSDIAFTGPTQSIKSNWKLLGSLVFDTVSLLKNINRFRQADILFSIGYTTIPLKVLMKFGFIKCRKLFWFGFFLHSPKSFPVFRVLSKLLAIKQERYIVFSKVEQSLYNTAIGIPLSKLIYVPWGNWDEEKEGDVPEETLYEEYYFSGGASNRDYLPLIETFRNRPEKLIIVCSSTKNKDILSIRLPPNIAVYTDLSAEEFDELVKGSKACLMLLKHNTGASGQSVLLRYMSHAKAIIASNQDVVCEYIENGVSGILICDPLTELIPAIERIGHAPQLRSSLGNAAHNRFITTFSRKAVSSTLRQALLEEAG